MKIYLVIIEDTHADVDVIPYYNKDKAIECAKEIAEKFCYDIADLVEEEIEGWLFYCRYSSESSLHVVEREII